MWSKLSEHGTHVIHAKTRELLSKHAEIIIIKFSSHRSGRKREKELKSRNFKSTLYYVSLTMSFSNNWNIPLFRKWFPGFKSRLAQKKAEWEKLFDHWKDKSLTVLNTKEDIIKNQRTNMSKFYIFLSFKIFPCYFHFSSKAHAKLASSNEAHTCVPQVIYKFIILSVVSCVQLEC